MEILLISVAFGAFSSIVTVFISKKINKAKFEVFIEQAKAKARVIEHEAEVALKDAQLKAKFECDREFKNARKEYENMLFKIEKKEKELNEHLENELRLIKAQKEEISENNRKIAILKDGIEEQKRTYEQKTLEAIKILENASGLTKSEAKELMLKKVEEDSRAEIASIFRKKYKLAEQNSKQEVNNILSQAVTRYAGEFAAERLINNIPLNDEETKLYSRMIHASGDVGYADIIKIGEGAITKMKTALKNGCNIYTDVEMVRTGINKKKLASMGGTVFCKIADEQVAATAKKEGITRSMAAMREFGTELNGAIVAIGNAPTALFEVIRLMQENHIRPAAVVGTPVGFVGAAESKKVLAECSPVPYVTVAGTKGGSPIAASCVNAVMYMIDNSR